eukprot:10589902-Alexandrium_andersonii.AAC.1
MGLFPGRVASCVLAVPGDDGRVGWTVCGTIFVPCDGHPGDIACPEPSLGVAAALPGGGAGPVQPGDAAVG